jgi:Asp-tRNA(Asn)/Glu-tRNA(Gln) amidotransferase C subunit
MSDPNTKASELLQSIARYAGLSISEEQRKQLENELEQVMVDLKTPQTQIAPDSAPHLIFDPRWH